jgi:two-component sensor histidine kinase
VPAEYADHPEYVPSFALLFHELATNAANHSALSPVRGHMAVEIHAEREQVAVRWCAFDSNAPIAVPSRQGFRSHIEKAAMRGLILRKFFISQPG